MWASPQVTRGLEAPLQLESDWGFWDLGFCELLRFGGFLAVRERDLMFFFSMEREMDNSGSDAGKKMKELTRWSSLSSVPSPFLRVNPFVPVQNPSVPSPLPRKKMKAPTGRERERESSA